MIDPLPLASAWPTAPGELLWRPALEPVWIALVASLAAAAIAWDTRKRLVAGRVGPAARLTTLRLLAVLAIAVTLMGPSRPTPPDQPPGRPPLTVIVDVSASMRTEDTPTPASAPPPSPAAADTADADADADSQDRSRLGFLRERWLTPAVLDRLEETHRLRWIAVGEDSRPSSRATFAAEAGPVHTIADDGATRLVAALENVADGLSHAPGAAALLLSDGRDTDRRDLPDAADAFRRKGVALHTVTIGRASARRDLSVSAFAGQSHLYPDEPGRLIVRLSQNRSETATTTLRVWKTDSSTRSPSAGSASGAEVNTSGQAAPQNAPRPKADALDDGDVERPASRRSQADAAPGSPGPVGSLVTARRIVLNGEATSTVSIPIRHAKPGTYLYTLQAAALPGETDLADNRGSVFVEVRERRINALLLEGRPHWDTKFLSQVLRRDERIALTTVTQVTPDRRATVVTRADAPDSLPTDLASLRAYDLILLGRRVDRLLDGQAIASLNRYVEAGGAVVFTRGPATPITEASNARALAPIEPVSWADPRARATDKPARSDASPPRLTITAAGRTHPSFAPWVHSEPAASRGEDEAPPSAPAAANPTAANPAPSDAANHASSDAATPPLPTLERRFPSEAVRPHARVLAVDQRSGEPLMVEARYGEGRTLALLGDGLWRWRLRNAPTSELDGYFDFFWSAVVRALALGDDPASDDPVRLTLDQRNVRVGEDVAFDVRWRWGQRRAPVRVTLRTPDGRVVEPELTEAAGDADDGPDRVSHRGAVRVLTPGVHRLALDSPALRRGEDGPAASASSGPTGAHATRRSGGRRVVRFNAFASDLERSDPTADPAGMRRLAQATGGRALPVDRPEALFETLERRRVALRRPAESQPIWRHGLWMLALLSTLGGEWILRQRRPAP